MMGALVLSGYRSQWSARRNVFPKTAKADWSQTIGLRTKDAARAYEVVRW